jgi:FkbM family methyltransferase
MIGEFTVCGLLRHRRFLESLAAGTYESFSQEIFERATQPGSIVVDGGAHIGLYSLIASRKVTERRRVLAFEPDPHNFKALTYNLRINHCQLCRGLKQGSFRYFNAAILFASTANISGSLFRRVNRGKLKELKVEATTIDEEVSVAGATRLVAKLVVEGAELKGSEGNGTNHLLKPELILVEINKQALGSASYSPSDPKSMLWNMRVSVWLTKMSRPPCR